MIAIDLVIDRLGTGGDGVARLPEGGSCYVAQALPGELVRATPAGRRGEGQAAVLEAVLRPAFRRRLRRLRPAALGDAGAG